MIKLTNILSEGRSLYVFDFDDTLARSEAYIYVKKRDGSELTLDPAEYAVYKEEPGDEFDFRDFNKMLRNPVAIKDNMRDLKKALSNRQNKVTVLTARALAFPLRYYFKKQHGISPYVVGVASADPKKKSDWIEKHIKKGYTTIYFADDSAKNIRAVDALKTKYPGGDTLPKVELMYHDSSILSQEEFINKIKTDDEFAKKWGELGPIYGKQWRGWDEDTGVKIDQIQNSINLLKTDPDSRRNIVSAWNVGELDQMTLPPCHNFFQFYTRELSEGERGLLLQPYGLDPLTKEGRDRVWKENNLPTRAISLMWNQRSVDTFLGLPFNIASYGLLLEIIAKEVNMVPDELIGNLGDVHLYKNHIEQAKEQIGRELSMEEKEEWCRNNSNHMDCPMYTREPMELPTLKYTKYLNDVDEVFKNLEVEQFEIENYESHPTIKAELSN